MVKIFGHRGARGVYPENTLDGFKYAAGLGIYGIEMDVVVSGDKKVVVSHEPWMNPKTCTKPDNSKVSFLRRKNLYRMPYETIRQYDCGLRGHIDFPSQKKTPAYKPLMTEVIKMVEEYTSVHNLPKVVYNIEIKSHWVSDNELHPAPKEFVELIINELLPFQINDRILLQSFDMRPLKIIHEKQAGFIIGMLVNSPLLIRGRKRALGFTPETCGVNYRYVTERWVKRIHNMGMQVLVWTENEESDISRHITMGVDGIITDYPERALAALKHTK